jgi:hypothetical protein
MSPLAVSNISPAGYQRRIKNVDHDIPGQKKGEWSSWSECTPAQYAYGKEFGSVEGFDKMLRAEVRVIYAMVE